MLFFTNQILKAQKHINQREYCHHVKQFILASANSGKSQLAFVLDKRRLFFVILLLIGSLMGLRRGLVV